MTILIYNVLFSQVTHSETWINTDTLHTFQYLFIFCYWSPKLYLFIYLFIYLFLQALYLLTLPVIYQQLFTFLLNNVLYDSPTIIFMVASFQAYAWSSGSLWQITPNLLQNYIETRFKLMFFRFSTCIHGSW